MASHFKTEDEPTPRGGRSGGDQTRRASSAASGAHGSAQGQHVARTGRGGDESYHAPRSNPYAANINETVDEGFISVMSESADSSRGRSKRNKRRRQKEFKQTDPYDIKGKRDKDPKRRRMRILSNLLLAVGVVLVIVALGMYLFSQWRYAKQDEVNEELATYAEVSDDGSTYPTVDWDALKAVNSDVVAWIQIPGTVVNYPVYQGSSNDEYLHTNAWGEYSFGGQIFMDYQNTAPGLVDMQTIVYGHHLLNGSMFACLADMEEDEEYFDSIGTIWYVTEDAAYELEPLLVYHAEADDTTVRQFSFSSTEEFQSYLTELLAKASNSADDAAETIASTEKVLTLCTCSYTQEIKGRMVLVCTIRNVTYLTDDAESADATAETTDSAEVVDGTDASESTDAS